MELRLKRNRRSFPGQQKTLFGDLSDDYCADKKVPAEEIKIEIWGRFEKRRSRETNEIKGFEISKIHRAGR